MITVLSITPTMMRAVWPSLRDIGRRPIFSIMRLRAARTTSTAIAARKMARTIIMRTFMESPKISSITQPPPDVSRCSRERQGRGLRQRSGRSACALYVGTLPYLQRRGHQHERLSVGAVELDHQIDDIACGLTIQVSRRFVGPHDGRLVDQRASDGYPLALASRELSRNVVGPVCKADQVKHLHRPGARL